MAGLAWHAGRTGLEGGRRSLLAMFLRKADHVMVISIGCRFLVVSPRPHRLFSCVRLQYEPADAGQTYGVHVAVTNVDARNLKFDITVDDQPKP